MYQGRRVCHATGTLEYWRQRDPSGVTEQRVRHAVGISLGRAEQRDPYRVTEQRVCHAGGISLGRAEQRDASGVAERRIF